MAADESLGPFDSFKDEDVWSRLREHPDTRAFCADAGYVATIERLRHAKTQADTKDCIHDPRVMQSLAVLQGWGLTVSPEDLVKAEWLGHMPKREAVQMANLERAAKYTTTSDAKAAGNAFFKEGKFDDALACWMRAFNLYESGGQSLDEQTRSTLYSNSALALVKLKRPLDALNACELALKAAPSGSDVSKVHFRQAMAHEQLSQGVGVSLSETSRQLGLACDAMRTALTAAQIEADSSAKSANIRNIQQELRRMKGAHKAAEQKVKDASEQAVREAEAAKLRGTGQSLPDTGGASSLIRRTAPGYVRDIDLSHWAVNWFASEVVQIRHSAGPCVIQVIHFVRETSDIHASVKEKNQKRSLFYDISIVLNFKGSYRKVRAKKGNAPAGILLHAGSDKMDKEMVGVFRMYNVGQDTRFCPGGDKETSYMYELGFDKSYYVSSEPWVETVKDEAGELFHLLGPLIGKFQDALAEKASQVA